MPRGASRLSFCSRELGEKGWSHRDGLKLPALDQDLSAAAQEPGASCCSKRPACGNAYGPLIVVAEQTRRGRVLYIGADTLWKWQTLTTAVDANTTPYHQFWHQTLRALAPTRPGGTGVSLWLQPYRSRYEAGQRAMVRAEIDAPGGLPHATIQGIVTLPDGKSVPLGFTLDPAANTYLAEFQADQAGPYRLTAPSSPTAKTSPRAPPSSTSTKPVQRMPPSPSIGPTWGLTSPAATGGKVIDPTDRETWPVRFGQETTVSERTTLDVWNRGWLLASLVLVAGVDWLLRLLRACVRRWCLTEFRGCIMSAKIGGANQCSMTLADLSVRYLQALGWLSLASMVLEPIFSKSLSVNPSFIFMFWAGAYLIKHHPTARKWTIGVCALILASGVAFFLYAALAGTDRMWVTFVRRIEHPSLWEIAAVLCVVFVVAGLPLALLLTAKAKREFQLPRPR